MLAEMAEQIKAKRRRLDEDLEEFRIAEQRRREDLTRKAMREERERQQQLAAAGAHVEPSPLPLLGPGSEKQHEGTAAQPFTNSGTVCQAGSKLLSISVLGNQAADS